MEKSVANGFTGIVNSLNTGVSTLQSLQPFDVKCDEDAIVIALVRVSLKLLMNSHIPTCLTKMK